MVPYVVWSTLLALFHTGQAIPQTAFPINSQVPPLAHVAQLYDFQFSQNTFVTTEPNALTYSLQDAPGWLSIDSSARSFAGTPNATDVGSFSFQLIASDGSGSTSLPVTLVVTDAPAPNFTANLTAILGKAGSLSDVSSLSMYPKSKFSITFPEDAFAGTGNLTYYATSGDRSPLPSWIVFDSTTINFSGITTPPVPNPQVVPIRIIASSVAGFAAASLIFNLIISDHQFVFSSIYQDCIVNEGDSVLMSTSLQLDGSVMSSQSVSSVKASAPDWLQFHPTNLTLSGQVPNNFQRQTVRLIASDNFNDVAYTYLSFNKRGPSLVPLPLTSTSSNAANSTASPNSVRDGERPSQYPGRSRSWIAAAVVGPAIAIILALAIGIWCLKRRKMRIHLNNYIDHFAAEESIEKNNGFWRGHQAVVRRPKTAGKRLQSPALKKANARALRLSKNSPMGSGEERVWESNERSLSAVSHSIPPPPLCKNLGLHPLRSNGVSPSLRHVKGRDRLSLRSDQWGFAEMRGGRGQYRLSRGSSSNVLGVEQSIVIPKCENCESDKLACRNCGSRQIKSALEQVRAHRRSKIETAHQPRTASIENSFDEQQSSLVDEKERERREAEEYVSRPLEERFQDYQDQKKASGTRERFSNSGNGSRTSSYATRRQPSSSKFEYGSTTMMRIFSSKSIPEEDPLTDIEHVTRRSHESSRSWITEGNGCSPSALKDFLDTSSESVEEAMRTSTRNYQTSRGGEIRRVPPDDEAEESDEMEASSGLQEEIPSSDAKAFP